MDIIHHVDHWTEKHHPIALDILRIALGLFLFVKGVLFIQDTEALQRMMANSQFEWVSFGLVHLVALAHLGGGLLIALGLVTRFASIVQIPILLGAVIFVNSTRGFYSENHALWLSVITLILLVFYAFYGSGRLSLDHYMRKHPDAI